MAAPVKPETESQQQQRTTEENGNQQTETPAQDSQQTQTEQQGETPQQRSERLLALYEQGMREAHQRASRLQDQLDQQDRTRREAVHNEPPVVPEISASEFWNKPLPHIAQIIRDETRKAVQPLYEFKQQVENQTKYDHVKNRFKADPRYREIFPKIENIVDQMMNGQDPNDALMNATILSAIGALHTGQLPGVTLEAPANNNNRGEPPVREQPANQGSERVVTPPHLRPSPMQQQQQDNKPKLRDLTELEDRLRRENGQTKEEFLGWLDLPATEVATSKIGRPLAQPNQNPDSQVVRTPNSGQGR
jgi:hypothetical protein